MRNNKAPKVLIYDIETTPLLTYVWRLGEQVIYHHQLVKPWDKYNIICISYMWDTDIKAKTIHWDYKKQDSAKVVREFDKIIKKADIALGKNSDRFDVKHINAQRLIHNLPPLPQWMDYTDDVEKQIRKHFILPSYGLDYISKEFGMGGKVKMDFQDWVDILEKKNKKSFQKMCYYNRKDVEDTKAIWNKIKPYIKPKFNMSVFYGDIRCTNCGGQNVRKDGTRIKNQSTYQELYCKDHYGYAGRVLLNDKNIKLLEELKLNNKNANKLKVRP